MVSRIIQLSYYLLIILALSFIKYIQYDNIVAL